MPPANRIFLTSEQEARLKVIWFDLSYGLLEICAELKISNNSLYRIAKELNLPLRRRDLKVGKRPSDSRRRLSRQKRSAVVPLGRPVWFEENLQSILVGGGRGMPLRTPDSSPQYEG